jgi:long-chain fatty acid adenylyltransferase FadD28
MTQRSRLLITSIDYEQDGDGVAESLTWSQLYHRALDVRHEFSVDCQVQGTRSALVLP